jgi:hypothetical protein
MRSIPVRRPVVSESRDQQLALEDEFLRQVAIELYEELVLED